MIEYIENGNVLRTRAALIVCPVNCVGVLGAGLAKAMARKWHTPWRGQYKEACKAGLLRPGGLRHFPLYADRWIACIATKNDWRDPSRIDWVAEGLGLLRDLGDGVRFSTPRSIALPAVGCGLGGLCWDDVRPLIEFHFADYAERVEVYAPKVEWR